MQKSIEQKIDGNMDMVTCPRCPYFKRLNDLLDVCELCGLGRTRGIVAAEDTQDYVRQNELEIMKRRKYFRQLHRRFFSKKEKGNLLDVGCADSLLIDVFEQHGWRVFGIDTYFDLNVEDTRLRRLGLSDIGNLEKYDLITMVHSFEHMSDSNQVIRNCRKLLVNGGQLLIVVPNYGGTWSCLTGKNWCMCAIEHHCYHYTRESLTRILIQNGLEIKDVRTYSNYAPSPSQVRRAEKRFYEHGLPSIQPFRSILFRANSMMRPIYNFAIDQRMRGAELQVLAINK